MAVGRVVPIAGHIKDYLALACPMRPWESKLTRHYSLVVPIVDAIVRDKRSQHASEQFRPVLADIGQNAKQASRGSGEQYTLQLWLDIKAGLDLRGEISFQRGQC